MCTPNAFLRIRVRSYAPDHVFKGVTLSLVSNISARLYMYAGKTRRISET